MIAKTEDTDRNRGMRGERDVWDGGRDYGSREEEGRQQSTEECEEKKRVYTFVVHEGGRE